MKNILPLTRLIVALSQSSAAVHDAPTHQHAEAVLLPPYCLAYGKAGGAAALTAAHRILATFTSDELPNLMFNWASNKREN